MSGYTCAVKDCKNITSRAKGVSFFRFPKNLQRAELWLKSCNRHIEIPLEKLHNNYRICGQHFTSTMFLNNLKNRLQPHAVPTINLVANLKSSSKDYVTMDLPKDVAENMNKPSTSKSQHSSEKEMINIFNEYEIKEVKKVKIINRIMENKQVQTESILFNHTLRERKLRCKNVLLQKRNKNLQKRLEVIKTKTKDSITFDEWCSLCDKFLPSQVAAFSKTQAQLHRQSQKEYCNINTDNYAEGQDQILTNFNQSRYIKSIEETRMLFNDHDYCNLNL